MTNEFVRIGQLLVDLGRNLPTEVDPGDLEDLRLEFVRIKSRLLMIWSQRPPELLYVLEFHSAEGFRLFARCKRGHWCEGVAGKGSAEGLFRVEVYQLIFKGLAEVIEHLELLKEGKDIELRLG